MAYPPQTVRAAVFSQNDWRLSVRRDHKSTQGSPCKGSADNCRPVREPTRYLPDGQTVEPTADQLQSLKLRPIHETIRFYPKTNIADGQHPQ
jgi:hypothetical protein